MSNLNPPAQAGDEPMGICCYGGPLKPKSSCAARLAMQRTTRATADVERNLRAELINEGALRQYCHNDGSAGFVTAYDFNITNRFLAAIATTKPGA